MNKITHWPLTVLSTVVSLLQLLLPLTLVRIFSQDDIGTYKVFFLYYGILHMLSGSAGFIHGVYYWSHVPQRGRLLMQQVWSVLCFYSVVLLLVGGCALNELALLLGGSQEQALLFVVSGVLFLTTSFYEEAWVAQDRIWQSAIFRALTEILRTGLILLCAWQTRDITLVFLVHTVAMLGKYIVGTALSARQALVRLVFNRELLREVLRYAVPVSVAGFLAAIANSADSMLLSGLLSKAEFAVFAIGCLAVPPLVALEQSVNQVLTTRLSQCLSSNDRGLAVQQYAAAVWELARFMVPSCVGLIVFAEPIVRILFTSLYLESVPILQLYALGYLLSIIPYDGGPKASGDGAWALRIFLYKSIFSVLLVLLLTPRFGVYGAMTGVLLSGVYLRVAGVRFNVRRFGWKVSEFIPGMRILRMSVVSVILAVICVAARSFFSDDRLWFVVAGGGFSLIYGALYLLPGRVRVAI